MIYNCAVLPIFNYCCSAWMELLINVFVGLIICKIEQVITILFKNERFSAKFQVLFLLYKYTTRLWLSYFSKYLSYKNYRNPYNVISKVELDTPEANLY